MWQKDRRLGSTAQCSLTIWGFENFKKVVNLSTFDLIKIAEVYSHTDQHVLCSLAVKERNITWACSVGSAE